jgi:hypothetical protein
VAFNICGFSVANLISVALFGAYNFELASRFLENSCIPGVNKCIKNDTGLFHGSKTAVG